MPGSRVYVVSGSVFATQGNNPAHRVINSEPIVSDTLVSTGDKSAAMLRFEDGETVTMQANSIFKVREYRYDAKKIGNSNIVFSMLKGGMRFITGLIGQRRKQAFRLLTPNVTIGIRGTDFMVAMADNSLYSQVLTGKIAMTNAAGMKTVGAGQSAVAASSGALAALVPASTIPAGTFSELLAIPVQPSAIPAPAPEPTPVVPAEPAAAAAPVPDVLSGTAAASAATGATADVAGVSTGVGGGAMAGMAGSDSASTRAAAETATPVVIPEVSPEPAKAADENAMDTNSRSDVGLTGKIGTLGYGAELNLGLTDSVGARIGLNAFTYKHNANSSTVNYDFNLQMQTVSALADWYPFKGSFRTSAGLMYNNNKVSLAGLPTGGSYTINGTTYTSADVGSLQGTMTFNKVAPYLGIGWGNPVAKNKGWGMTSDIGVLFQGNPKTSLVATCGATLPAPQCTTLQNDAAAENTKLQNDLSNFKWWPVVAIGISYQW